MITSIPGFKPVDDGADAPKPTPMVATQPSDAPVQQPELIPAVAPKPLIDNPPADPALLGIAGTNLPPALADVHEFLRETPPVDNEHVAAGAEQFDPVVPADEPGPTDEQISAEADDTIAALEKNLAAALLLKAQHGGK